MRDDGDLDWDSNCGPREMDEFGLYFGGIADKSCSSIVCDRQKEE